MGELLSVKVCCPHCSATHVRPARAERDDLPETLRKTCLAPHPSRGADFEGCGRDDIELECVEWREQGGFRDDDPAQKIVTDGGVSQTHVGHCKRDDYDVYIGRGPGGRDMLDTPVGEPGWLGNPHRVDDHGRAGSIERFRIAFESRLENDSTFRRAVANLHGKTLGCWCRSVTATEPACHGDVIVEHAERLASKRQITTAGGQDSSIPPDQGYDCPCGSRYRNEMVARICCNGAGGVE
jgi:hypothetical protein